MTKRAKRRSQNAQCPICGRMFTGQGLSGHMRFVHNVPVRVSSKRHRIAKIGRLVQDANKRAPTLIKPLMTHDELIKVVLTDIELQDHREPSPCCKVELRSAKRVLGIPDLALDGCYICANCGEWYHQEADQTRPIARLRDGTVLYGTRLRHLPQEIPEDKEID